MEILKNNGSIPTPEWIWNPIPSSPDISLTLEQDSEEFQIWSGETLEAETSSSGTTKLYVICRATTKVL